jgi:hypothetical protein
MECAISLTECNSGTIKKMPFGVNNKIELKIITSVSENNGTHYLEHTLLDVIVVGFRSYIF